MSVTNEILKKLKSEPLVASEMYNSLENKYPRATVKATVSRLVSQKRIFRSKLNLSHNDSILTVNSNFSSPPLIKKLIKNNFYGRAGLSILVQHLTTSAPSVSLVDIAKLTAARIGQEPYLDWSSAQEIVNGLEEIGLLKKRDNVEEWYLNKSLLTKAKIKYNKTNLTESNTASIEKLRFLQIQSISDWLSRNGFVSYGGNHIANEAKPVISGYGLAFDFLGFCFIRGIIERPQGKKPIPLPILGDVQVGVCTLTYAKSFKLRLIEVSGVIKKMPMGFILAKGFSQDAFEFLKREGIHAWAFDNLFGEKSAKAIADILEISQKIGEGKNTTPEKIGAAIEGVDSFGGSLGNLKGQLFEMMIGYFVSNDGFGTVLGKKIPQKLDTNKNFEIDVLGTQNKTAIIYECKGIKKDNIVEHDEVKKHFNSRTPSARDYLIKNPPPTSTIDQFKSIFVTTGDFSKETLDEFSRFKSRHDTTFELWDRSMLISKLKKSGHKPLIDIIERYY